MSEVYTDGGMIGSNPSIIGGTYAWCEVVGSELLRWESGVILPAHLNGRRITNNITELWAVLSALEELSADWDGVIHTDSLITLRRMTNKSPSMKGIPRKMLEWWGAIRRKHRGKVRFNLVAGHPSQKELEDGFNRYGKPVSAWNKWCDDECRRMAFEEKERRKHSA